MEERPTIHQVILPADGLVYKATTSDAGRVLSLCSSPGGHEIWPDAETGAAVGIAAQPSEGVCGLLLTLPMDCTSPLDPVT